MPQTISAQAPAYKPRLIRRVVLVAAVVLVLAVTLLVLFWPFSRKAVVGELEDTSLSEVTVGAYHGTYFPRPGCVLEHVTFQHNAKPGSPPLITVESVRIEGSYAGLLARHVKVVRADGVHILVPPPNTENFRVNPRATVVVDELIADGAILEVSRRESPPLKFSFHNFTISNVGASGPATFHAKFSNPEPPGEISADGNFGPWNESQIGKTKVSGEYALEQANLGVFPGIAGILSSSGKFTGELDHIEVQGTTDTPKFTVTYSSHKVDLQTQFNAEVNGENGDTLLQHVAATFWKTTVWSKVGVEGKNGKPGKTVSAEIAVKDGRIQDILRLFAQAEQAPMSGVTGFYAKVSIPPGRRPFLKKVELEGDFGVDAGTFSNLATQQGVNHLSQGARGEPQVEAKNEGTALSDLKGHVVLKDGTANLSNLSFTVPGASAHMHGTYDLIGEKIDLHGTLKTDSSPSKTSSGAKAMILKVLQPFFKKNRAGYEMPVKITGTYEHPSFGLDIGNGGDKKRQQKNWQTLGLPAPPPQ